jgi:hypothetical protein
LSNVELRLLSTMLATGDFGPIVRGDVEKSTFLTDAGKIVFHFILNFRYETDQAIRFPTLSIAQNRFATSGIELPNPAPGDTVPALVHEVRMGSFRARVEGLTHELALACKQPEGLMDAVSAAVARLKAEIQPIQKAKRASLSDDFMDVLADYDCGAILTEGTPWPWPSMQRITKGLQNKEFVVVAGRPKSRKTFIAGAIAAHAVKEHNARVLFISPEMPARQVLLRFIATLCGLHYTEFKDGSLPPEEEARLLETARLYGRVGGEALPDYAMRLTHALGTAPGHIPCFEVLQGTSQTVDWIESQVETYRPDIIIVDSFYRLRGEGARKNDTDWKVISAMSRSLKDLAMNTNTCVIGTHQMNRDAENKVGTTGNLALADAIGQDADIILRVITGKKKYADRSAIAVLGGREVPFDGVMINNRPCYDFEEIDLISRKSQLEQLMVDEDDEDEDGQEAKKGKGKGPKKVAAAEKIATIAQKALGAPQVKTPPARTTVEAFLADDDEAAAAE